MKTVERIPEAVITKTNMSKVEGETRTVERDRDIMIFKGSSLEELLGKAAELQSLIALIRPWYIYELEATYNITSGEWIGRLFPIS